MPDNTPTLTQDELKDTAQAAGKRLGFFISALNVSDEVKETFLDILPHLELEQLERLTNILESKYLAQETESIDQEFKAELEKIKSDYEERAEAADKEALGQIEALAAKLG